MPGAVAAHVGHPEYCYLRHSVRYCDGVSGGLFSGTQHHAASLGAQCGADGDCLFTINQLADLGDAAGDAFWAPACWRASSPIALRSIGFVGKLLYESIEEIHPTPVEAISATGASRMQVMNYGVLPQIMPAFAGISVYRWDINIRESTVLGLVGAGGIGLQLNASINSLAWDQVSVIFLMIFATVLVSEWISARVRHAII